MEYIQANKDIVEDRCVFCALLEDGDPDGDRILRREQLVFVALAKYPYAPGHLLVLPTRHVADIEELTDDEHAAIARLGARPARSVRTPWVQHRPQPRPGGGRRHPGAPPLARRSPLGRGYELHAGDRTDAGDARALG